MDIQRFKKQKDALIKMNVPFAIFTDENCCFIHDPINHTSIISFDDEEETFVCIKKSDTGLKNVNIVEYDRALLIQLTFSNNKNIKDFIDKCESTLITQKQKEELHNLLK